MKLRHVLLLIPVIAFTTLPEKATSHECDPFDDNTTVEEIKACMNHRDTPVAVAPVVPVAPTVPIVDSEVCLVDSVRNLTDCLVSGNVIALRADLAYSGCPVLLDFNNKSDIEIMGNNHKITRVGGQRDCSLLEMFNSRDITINELVLDDNADVGPCVVDDNCPRMLHIKDSSNIVFDTVDVINGKGYVIYTDRVDGFEFTNGSLKNSGVLGMYIGHGDRPSRNVSITNTQFSDNSTNALALLGAENVVVKGNAFTRNHLVGQWSVEPRFGTGMTGGGQFYIARAKNVVVDSNVFTNGACAGCKGGVHGIELSEPNKSDSVDGLRIVNNTLQSHTGTGVYLNGGATVQNLFVARNRVEGSVQRDYSAGITVSDNLAAVPTAPVITPTIPTHVVSNGACTATGTNLDNAKAAFASQCAGIRRDDCDPAPGGGWICSSEAMGVSPGSGSGAIASGNSSGAGTPSSPVQSSTASLRVEAESVPLTSGWQDRGDGSVTWEHPNEERYLLTQRKDESNLTYRVQIPQTGTYRFTMRATVGRIFNPAEPPNDFWVKVGNNDWIKAWYTRDGSWQIDAIGEQVHDKSRELLDYQLSAGTTTVIISGRSRGAVLDWFELVPQGFSVQTSTVQVPASTGGKLISIHGDAAPDQDEMQAMIMHKLVMEKVQTPHMVVIGTSGRDPNDPPHLQFIQSAVPHVRSMWPDALDAYNELGVTLPTMAKRWTEHLQSGGTIDVVEGGPSDITAMVLRLLPNDVDKKKITVFQHSAGVGAFNEDKTLPANLAYVKASTTYRAIPNGNVGGNGSADFQEPASSAMCQRFMQRALSSKYASQWRHAFSLIEDARKCDGSDNVELLMSVGDVSTKTFDDFVSRYF